MRDRRPVAVALFVCGVLAGAVWPARSCGPDLPSAVFTLSHGPDQLESFTAGRLGILVPSYYQRYLYLSYRILTGHALAGDDLAAALRFPASSLASEGGGLERWQSTRDSLVNERASNYITPDCSRKQDEYYFYYPNYFDAAFWTAERTLRDRVTRQGGVDAAVRDWVAAQDAVFMACKEGASPPTPAPDASPGWLVKDRAYQTAAWNFYAGNFDAAITGFQAIGQDRDSPWRELGPYLAARGYVRKGTVTAAYRALDEEALRHAEEQLERVLADASVANTHAAARRLLEYVRFRLYPTERLAKLSRSLQLEHPGRDLDQQVFDLTILLDRFSDPAVESLATVNPDYELADWILSFQGGNFPHAVARWRATRSSAWLVSAMTSAQPGKPEVAELLHTAARVSPKDPGFASIAFHRARLLAGSGKEEEARRVLDALPHGDKGPFPPSSWNLALQLRMRLARSFDEFLAAAPRQPSMISGYYESWDNPPREIPAGALLLDHDGAYLLNRWAPVAAISKAASSGRLGRQISDPMTLAAWTRAVVVDDHALGVPLAATLASTDSFLAPYLDRYRAARDAPARRFEATWLLLHTPGASPWVRTGVGRVLAPNQRDTFRDNWWPAEGANQTAWFMGPREGYDPQLDAWTGGAEWDAKLAAAILSPAERAQADRERAALAKAGPGANFMCEQTLVWAKGHPTDPRLPEALHLSVQATRYGYADVETRVWSRKAFTLLHNRFPKTEWARKTKYWY